MRNVIISSNENPKYMYFLPLVHWAWRKFNWNPVVLYSRKVQTTLLTSLEVLIQETIEALSSDPFSPIIFTDVEFKTDIIAQVSRLHAASFLDGYIMTSDVDMIPLSDYWNPDESKVTTYGRDLTDYHFPICYIGMDAEKWRSIMDIPKFTNKERWSGPDRMKFISRDLRDNKNVWVTDQNIITERLLKYGKQNIVHIDRGTDKRTGYPIGRVDRSGWTLDHRQFIDCHAPHDVLTNEASFHKLMQLLHTVFPKENWSWFIQYHKEFKKLL